MTVIEKGAAQRPAYIDGKIKLMLIDGRWVPAASGRTFESRNPATGEVLATVAEGDREDIDRAVAAARKAFDGPWSKWKPAERQMLLLKLADLVDSHIEELAALDTYDMGAPISRTRNNRQRARRHAALLRRHGDRAARRDHRELAAGRDLLLHAEGAGRRGRRHHPVERPAHRHHLEDRTGAGDGLHRGAEARRGGAAHLAAAGRALPRGGRAARRGQRRAGLRRDRRRGAGRASRCRQGGVHRLAPAPARRSSRPRPAISSACRSSSAASRPTSSSPTPISTRRCPAPAWRCSPIRGQICSAGTRLFVEKQDLRRVHRPRSPTFAKALRVGNGADPQTQVGPLVSPEQLDRVTDLSQHRPPGRRARG